MTTRMTQVVTAMAAVLVTALPAQGQVAQGRSAVRPRAALALMEMSASLEAAVRLTLCPTHEIPDTLQLDEAIWRPPKPPPSFN
jgi:hypothetical protein